MTAAERDAIDVIVEVAQHGEWVTGKCPRCGFSQARGHKCSCPVKRAYKLLHRALGKSEPALDDEDLIVERALSRLAWETDHRAIVWDAVEAAMRLGARK